MSGFDEKGMLTRELRERAHDIGGHPIALDAVKRSARRVQWHRRLVTGVAAAVVLTVAVPAGLAVSHTVDGTAPGPVKQPTQGVTHTPSPTPTGPVLLATDAPRGPAPSVPYVLREPRQLVAPDGSVTQLPAPYERVVPYDGGLLAIRGSGPGPDAALLTLDGSVRERFDAGDSLAVSPDGLQVAYVRIGANRAETLIVADTNGGDPHTWSFPTGQTIRPVGFLGRGTLVYERQESETSTPVVAVASVDRKDYELNGFVRVSDANMTNGLVSGQTSYSTGGSSWGVMDPASSRSKMLWQTRDYSLAGFSPDGRYVIAGPPDYDGWGPSSLSILEARTGRLVVTFRPAGDTQIGLLDRIWEDDGSVLATTLDGKTHSFLRMGVDGSLQRVMDPVKVDPYGNPPLWFNPDW